MDNHEKLAQLAEASQYDLSCACGTRDGPDHRRRGADGRWQYPTPVPRGGTAPLLKTLLTSACANDCRYCPLRHTADMPRYSLAPDELARAFMEYTRRTRLAGLFLSSGVVADADRTMERIVATAEILRRRHAFRGFLHLKIMPGAGEAAIAAAVAQAQMVSINLEVPRARHLAALSERKDFLNDLVRPMKYIAQLTAPGGPHAHVKQTTQFIVGAADETDGELLDATERLYRRWRVHRVYFSAYQREPAEGAPPAAAHAALTREHRLYQAEWLLRKYGFAANEIPVDAQGRLSLERDPKEDWALRHPERFPLDINTAARGDLLRVPGLGEVTVRRILKLRRQGVMIRDLSALGRLDRRLRKAASYLS